VETAYDNGRGRSPTRHYTGGNPPFSGGRAAPTTCGALRVHHQQGSAH